MNLICFNNVSKYYGQKVGISNISFDIKKGECVLFVGRNGSGKSTTLKLILGLLRLGKKDMGEIYNGASVISYLPERFKMPLCIKVSEYIDDLKKITNDDILNLLDEFNIDKNKKIYELSKGMKQKLGIIGTIRKNSELYIYDEPTNGLDEISIKKFINELKKLKMEGKTIIVATHYEDLYEEITDKKFIFENTGLFIIDDNKH